MPHNSRPPLKARRAADRYARLVKAGCPRVLTAEEAYNLSGGIIRQSTPLARVARDVPDCEAFLPMLADPIPVPAHLTR